MNKIFLTGAALIICCLSISCNKTIFCHGQILNAADNQPIKDVKITFACGRGQSGGGTEITDKVYAVTDSNGQFETEVDSKKADLCDIIVGKEGFVTDYKEFYDDLKGSHEVNFLLNPIDSWLNIIIQNESGTEKSFYHKYENPLLKNNSKSCVAQDCSTIVLQPGESRKDIIRMPGGTDVTIKLYPAQSGYPAPLLTKSVFCNREDTTTIFIQL